MINETKIKQAYEKTSEFLTKKYDLQKQIQEEKEKINGFKKTLESKEKELEKQLKILEKQNITTYQEEEYTPIVKELVKNGCLNLYNDEIILNNKKYYNDQKLTMLEFFINKLQEWTKTELQIVKIVTPITTTQTNYNTKFTFDEIKNFTSTLIIPKSTVEKITKTISKFTKDKYNELISKDKVFVLKEEYDKQEIGVEIIGAKHSYALPIIEDFNHMQGQEYSILQAPYGKNNKEFNNILIESICYENKCKEIKKLIDKNVNEENISKYNANKNRYQELMKDM